QEAALELRFLGPPVGVVAGRPHDGEIVLLGVERPERFGAVGVPGLHPALHARPDVRLAHPVRDRPGATAAGDEGDGEERSRNPPGHRSSLWCAPLRSSRIGAAASAGALVLTPPGTPTSVGPMTTPPPLPPRPSVGRSSFAIA